MRLIGRHEGKDFEIEVQRSGSGHRVRLGDRWMSVDFIEAGRFVRSLRLEDGTQFSFVHHREGNTHEITIAGSTVKVEIVDPLSLKRRRREDEASGGGVIKALMPGRVVRIMVHEGEAVTKGASLLILEAMKMENDIHAPVDGVIDRILVSPGQTVEGGAELVHLSS